MNQVNHDTLLTEDPPAPIQREAVAPRITIEEYDREYKRLASINPFFKEEITRKGLSEKYGIYRDEEGNYLPEVKPQEPPAKTCIGRFYQRHEGPIVVCFFTAITPLIGWFYFWLVDFMYW